MNIIRLKYRQALVSVVLFLIPYAHDPGTLHAEVSPEPEAAEMFSAFGLAEAPKISTGTGMLTVTAPHDSNPEFDDYIQSEESNGGYEAGEDDESLEIADPIAPFNKVMFEVNDKLYFWLLKPISRGYTSVVPEIVRTGFSNAYDNLKAPVRMANHTLQLRWKCAGNELVRFLLNSTIGIGGFDDVAKHVIGIEKQEADFGQTLGRYGIGHGLYIVWPILGPSSLRETVGFVGDRLLYPLTYISDSDLPIAATLGIAVHEKINDMSFNADNYELFKKSVIDPYVAMRDAFVQNRKFRVEHSSDYFSVTRNGSMLEGSQ